MKRVGEAMTSHHVPGPLALITHSRNQGEDINYCILVATKDTHKSFAFYLMSFSAILHLTGKI